VWVGPLVVKEIKRIIESSEIVKYVLVLIFLGFDANVWHRAPDGIFFLLFREDDTKWPKKNIVGKQELEIRINSDHISFEVCCLHSYFHAKFY
jgi:protein mago nashi